MNHKINEKRIMFSPLGDEAVVFDREKNEYITLNATMYTIFKHLCNNDDLETIQKKLMEEYVIDAISCKVAVERSVSELIERGFIIVC